MNPQALAEGVKRGDRRSLARALTLVESANLKHEKLSLELFSCLKESKQTAFRLGVTGPPGAGKSTLIESLVMTWAESGQKIAILAVDPSSQRTGGSLLGDKTRMGELAQHSNVFIRPSPAGEHLGGLGRRTPLMCALLERAGFQKIIVETVGVGQSEVAASYLVDKLLLVALPGAGDEVQGLKRGLMEEVDLVAVNKQDLGQSKATVAILRSALRVFRRDVPVLEVSAQTGFGLDKLHQAIEETDVSESRTRGELHFFEQYWMDSMKRLLQDSDLGDLRELVASGQMDFLAALPKLMDKLENLRKDLAENERS